MNMSINWKSGYTPISEITLENFPDFARDFAEYTYMLCYKATLDVKQAVTLSANALAAVACREAGKSGSDQVMPEQAIKLVMLDVLSKQQLAQLNNDDFSTTKPPSEKAVDAIVDKAVSIANDEMPRYARVFSGTKGTLVIVGLVAMLIAAIVLIWVNPLACNNVTTVVVAGKTGDVSAAAKPDADMLVNVTFDDSVAEKVNSGSYPVVFTLDGPDSRAVTQVLVYDSAHNLVDAYPCGEETYCFIAHESDVYQAVISSAVGERSAYFIVPRMDKTADCDPYYVVSHNDSVQINLGAGRTLTGQPSLGTLEENFGSYTYVPTNNAGGIGLDTFSFTEADGTLRTVPVLVCNSAPYIEPSSLEAQVKHTPSRSGMLAGVIVASDADGDELTFKLTESTGCSVMLSANGSYFALIEPEYRLEEAEFSFTVSDGIANSDPYTVKIALTNGLIAATEVTKTFVCYSGDSSYEFELPAYDDDGDKLTWSLVTDNVNGVTVQWQSRVTVLEGNKVRYRVNPIYNEQFTEVLTFSCSDGWANGTLMTVICAVSENRPPVSSGQNAATVPFNATSVLEVTVKDDCEFDRCAIVSVDNVVGGTVADKTGWNDMKFTFTHDGVTTFCQVTLTVADVLTGLSTQIVYDITAS